MKRSAFTIALLSFAATSVLAQAQPAPTPQPAPQPAQPAAGGPGGPATPAAPGAAQQAPIGAQEFAALAQNTNIFLLQVSAVAAQRAQADNVRTLAVRIRDEQTEANANLDQVLAIGNLAAVRAAGPDPDIQPRIDTLNRTNTDFDRAFADAVIATVTEARPQYEWYAANGDVEQLRNFARAQLAVLDGDMAALAQIRGAMPGVAQAQIPAPPVPAPGQAPAAPGAQAQGPAVEGQIIVEQAAPQVGITQGEIRVFVTQLPATVNVTQDPPQIIVRQPPPTIRIEIPQPIVTLDMPEPQIVVRMPDPEVALNAPQPEIRVEQGPPEVIVQQAQPEVRVAEPPPPAEVAARPAQAQVEMGAAAQPTVTYNPGQPTVAFERADPVVQFVPPPEPQVTVNRVGEAQITFERLGAGGQVAQAPGAGDAALTTRLVLGNFREDQVGPGTDAQIALVELRTLTVVGADGTVVGPIQDVVRVGDEIYVVVADAAFVGNAGRQVAIPLVALARTGNTLVLPVLRADQTADIAQVNLTEFEAVPPDATITIRVR